MYCSLLNKEQIQATNHHIHEGITQMVVSKQNKTVTTAQLAMLCLQIVQMVL